MAFTPNDLATEIEREIINGVLPPGEKLASERKLAEQYRVSRPVVREALRTLAERNLVEILPARGTFVTDDSGLDAARPLEAVYRRHRPTVRQLVEARAMLESEAAALAAQRATREDVIALRSAVERMENAPDQLEYVRYDVAFHLALARASHNPVIEIMFGSIAPMVVELMIRSASDSRIRSSSGPFHRMAYEAILERDASAAAHALAQHQEVGAAAFGVDYDRPIEVAARRELTRLLGRAASLGDLVDSLLAEVADDASP